MKNYGTSTDRSEVPPQEEAWHGPQWDYAVVSVIDEGHWAAETLWEHGDLGWELVSAQHLDGSVKLYFKRPK